MNDSVHLRKGIFVDSYVDELTLQFVTVARVGHEPFAVQVDEDARFGSRMQAVETVRRARDAACARAEQWLYRWRNEVAPPEEWWRE